MAGIDESDPELGLPVYVRMLSHLTHVISLAHGFFFVFFFSETQQREKNLEWKMPRLS